MVAVEPIVSEDLWSQCNLILDEQEKKNKRPARKTVQLFAGVVFCQCGNKMYVPSNSPKYICRKCRNKISTTDLEAVFHEQLKSFFFSPDEISHYMCQADQIVRDKNNLLESLLEEERKLQLEMDRVYKLYVDEVITTKGFGARYKPMEERQAQIEEQIPEIQAEIDFMKIQHLSRDQVLSEAQDLYSRWPELTYEHKREIIESITERIVIDKDEVQINLCFLPPQELMATEQRNSCR